MATKSPPDLKKFIIAELQRFEDEMGLAIQLEAEKTKIHERNLKHITDRYIQVLAMLDTITNSNPPENQPKVAQKKPSPEMKES